MTFPNQLLLGAPVGTTAGWVLGQLAVVYPTDADSFVQANVESAP